MWQWSVVPCKIFVKGTNAHLNQAECMNKGEGTPLVARIGKKKGRQTGATQFLVTFEEMQENAQVRQMEHECKMQQEAIVFQQKWNKTALSLRRNWQPHCSSKAVSFKST